jgi:hypothetical protein
MCVAAAFLIEFKDSSIASEAVIEADAEAAVKMHSQNKREARRKRSRD